MKLFLNVFMTCQYRHQGRVTEAQTPPCALCGSEYPAQHLKTFITPPLPSVCIYVALVTQRCKEGRESGTLLKIVHKNMNICTVPPPRTQ